MIRGTTPTFTLNMVDEVLDLTQAANVYATFRQRNNIITKTDLDISVTQEDGKYHNTVLVYLTQEETLGFVAGSMDIQLNWTYTDGSRACSNIVTIAVNNNLEGRVLE